LAAADHADDGQAGAGIHVVRLVRGLGWTGHSTLVHPGHGRLSREFGSMLGMGKVVTECVIGQQRVHVEPPGDHGCANVTGEPSIDPRAPNPGEFWDGAGMLSRSAAPSHPAGVMIGC